VVELAANAAVAELDQTELIVDHAMARALAIHFDLPLQSRSVH